MEDQYQYSCQSISRVDGKAALTGIFLAMFPPLSSHISTLHMSRYSLFKIFCY